MYGEGDEEDDGGFPEEAPAGFRADEEPGRTHRGERQEAREPGERDGVLETVADERDGQRGDDEAEPRRFAREQSTEQRGAADKMQGDEQKRKMTRR